MTKEPWEVQDELKYRDHDMVVSDLTEIQLETIKEIAAKEFIETRESSVVRLTVAAFMDYLTAKGYRIVKKAPR